MPNLKNSNQGIVPVYLLICLIVLGLIGFGVYKTFIVSDSSRNTSSAQVIVKYVTQPQIIPPTSPPKIIIITQPPVIVTKVTPANTSITSQPPKSNPVNPKPATPIKTESPQLPIVSDPVRNNPSNTVLNKKVLLVIFNPKIGSSDTISKFKWNNPDKISSDVISFFNSVTEGRLKFNLTKRVVLESFPKKTDGFVYTPESYETCIKSPSSCHNPDTADYLEILKITGACELLNAGEIDELWMWGGPYFGFYESNMAGPNSFWLNSGPTKGSSCNKILPIMGYNYERGVNEAVHNFGHRAESSMEKVYGSWDPKFTHSWNRFSLLNKDVTGKGGCGNTHYSAGSTKTYEYTTSKSFLSNCHEYINFPNIKDDFKEINCKVWGCTEIGYYRYWWTHFPQNSGKFTDTFSNKEVKNNWLEYVFDFSWVN